jgi:hypothetical protein
VLAEHLMHNGVHLGADADGLHDLDAESLDKVTRDDDLADEAHAQATVLGLDDHYPFALDQLALHERLPKDDDSVHQPLPVGLALRQGQVFLHQEALGVARLGIPPGHLGLVFAHWSIFKGWGFVFFILRLSDCDIGIYACAKTSARQSVL